MKTKLNIYLSLVILVFACKPKEDTQPSFSVSENEVVKQYAEVAYQQYSNAHNDAHSLESAIELFLANPTEEKLNTAREAWKTARRSYSLLESYRFYGGPIDNPETDYESKLNAWPMDESAVDYVVGNTAAGIINDIASYPTITSSIILENNGLDGETSITTGFHVIEFLLWGQDLSTNSAGQRPYTDYVYSTVSGIRLNAKRRGDFLLIVSKLTASYLHEITYEWAPNVTGNYRDTFTKSENTKNSMALILKGLGVFSKSEFGGERLTVAFETKDQEDEHDCFSDFTTAEIAIWQQGIINIYYGKYKKRDGTVVDGVGIDDLIKTKEANLATEVDKLLANNYTASLAVPDPFDNAITAGDQKIKTVIDGVRNQGDKFVTIASKLGYNITTDL